MYVRTRGNSIWYKIIIIFRTLRGRYTRLNCIEIYPLSLIFILGFICEQHFWRMRIITIIISPSIEGDFVLKTSHFNFTLTPSIVYKYIINKYVLRKLNAPLYYRQRFYVSRSFLLNIFSKNPGGIIEYRTKRNLIKKSDIFF